ncbi:hypothetical protein Ancab_005541, partial [Ancistrocladus abbreviatus]
VLFLGGQLGSTALKLKEVNNVSPKVKEIGSQARDIHDPTHSGRQGPKLGPSARKKEWKIWA